MKFNEKKLDNAKVNDDWLEFSVDPAMLKTGENVVSLTLQKQAVEPKDIALKTLWTDMMLDVRH